MRRIRDGDPAAFGVLYARHAGPVFGLAHRILRDRAAAEDVTQDVFAGLWFRRELYVPERGAPRAWLLTITRNRAIDVLRRSRRRDEPLDQAYDSAEAPERTEAEAFRRDAAASLGAALRGLPDEQRTVVELSYFGELTHAEIAARLSVPLGTVKSRVRLGLRRLAAGLEPSFATSN
jgi:RNA polymerase sigma-70 factor (ECF subfamily)